MKENVAVVGDSERVSVDSKLRKSFLSAYSVQFCTLFDRHS